VIVDVKKKKEILWVMHENDGLCVLIPIFRSLHKKRETKKNKNNYRKKIKNIYQWKKDTRAPRKWSKMGRESSKIQRLKFDSMFLTDEGPIDKENSI